MLKLIHSLYYKGRDAANKEIREIQLEQGTPAAKAYAHERHEQCDKTMNATKRDDRYSYSAGQAGAFGWMAANSYIMPSHPYPKKRKGWRR